MIDNILTNDMLPTLSTELLGRMADGVPVERIEVTAPDDKLHYEFVGAAA